MTFLFLLLPPPPLFSFPFRNPLYHTDFIYNLTPSGRKFNTNSEIVAQKADEIIKKRRQALTDQVSVFANVNDQDCISVFFFFPKPQNRENE